jgi:hypothetical protein
MQHQDLETPEPTPPYAPPKLEKLGMTSTENALAPGSDGTGGASASS